MSVTCLFQYTGIRIFNDHTCEQRIICSTRSVYIFLEKKTPFSPNIIFYDITAPRLNKKYVAPGHQNLAGEFCVVGGEFSDLRCLMNTLGSITIDKHLDRENVQQYSLTIQASDSASPPQTDRSTVRITVTDVNDFVFQFLKREYSKKIPENRGASFDCKCIR